uniref:PHB domain-containing protein n=1 Tax=Macrostomum lignano TaxID=282301 RepID=A0A1I8HHX9_9PLAT
QRQQRRQFTTGRRLPRNTGIMFVPQQEAWIIERFGKFSRILNPGLNFCLPVPAITVDNVTLQINGVLFLKVFDPYQASYGIEDAEFAMTQLAQTTMRSELGKISLDSVFRERDSLNRAIVETINQASEPWGINCLRYEIRDIILPPKIKDAMQTQVEADRRKRAAILESEGIRNSDINVAEGKKQAQILASEAFQREVLNKALGESEAIIRLAEARAQAIRSVADSLNQANGSSVVSMTIAEKYIEAFSKLAKSTNTVLLPAQSGDIASMVAQALAIYKSVDSSPSSPAPTHPPSGQPSLSSGSTSSTSFYSGGSGGSGGGGLGTSAEQTGGGVSMTGPAAMSDAFYASYERFKNSSGSTVGETNGESRAEQIERDLAKFGYGSSGERRSSAPMRQDNSLFLSTNERKAIANSIANQCRIDGRNLTDIRRIRCRFADTESGCVTARLGATIVVAKVTHDVVEPWPHRPAEGQLQVNLEVPSTDGSQQQQLDDDGLRAQRALERCFKESRCLDLESLCIVPGERVFLIRVTATVINNDGNVIDCAAMAVVLALADYRRPDVSLVQGAVSVGENAPVQLNLNFYPLVQTFGLFDSDGKYIVADLSAK